MVINQFVVESEIYVEKVYFLHIISKIENFFS